MPPTDRTCTDCGHPIAAGVLVDYRRGAARPSEWVEGELETGTWTGGVKNEVRYEIAAYRCTNCGLLKLYGDARASASSHTSG